MKSKERVAKQGVARGEEVGERIKSVWRGEGEERRKNKSVYFTVILLSRIFENDREKTGNFLFLSLPPSRCIFSFCVSFFISFFCTNS